MPVLTLLEAPMAFPVDTEDIFVKLGRVAAVFRVQKYMLVVVL